MNRKLEDYLKLNYPIELVRDEDAGYFAHNPDLMGCAAQGATAEEAVSSLDRAREMWIRERIAEGLAIPEPLSEDEPSGKLLLRIPRSIHGQLVRIASRDEVSINHLISTVLARYVGGQETVSGIRAIISKSSEENRGWWRYSTLSASAWSEVLWSLRSESALLDRKHSCWSLRIVSRREQAAEPTQETQVKDASAQLLEAACVRARDDSTLVEA